MTEFPDFQTAGWNAFLNSRASDGMFSRLSTVQTREDCTTILLSSGCPANLAIRLYGLSAEKGGYTRTSAVVEHAENLSLLLGAMQVRQSLLLKELVEKKEVLHEALDRPPLSRDPPTTVTPNSESSGGSDWSSSSSDVRHRAELPSGSGSDWEMPGSQSSSDTALSCSVTSLSSMEEAEMYSPQSPTGSPPSAKRAKPSPAASSEPS